MPRILFLIFLLFQVSILYGQRAPKYSNEFLSLGVGSRAFGMGNTQTATTNDVSAGYWNPAGLMLIKPDFQLSLMHAQYFSGIANYDYAGFTTRTDSSGRLGLSLIRFAVDDIPDTRFLYDANGNINYNNIRSFSAADYAFLFSYARNMSFLKGLSIGANAKMLHRSAGTFAKAWGFGIDAGAIYVNNSWTFGVMLRDITGTFTYWNHNREELELIYHQTGNDIPLNAWEITVPRLILGGNKNFRFHDHWQVNLALDLVHTFDGQRNTLLGSNIISFDPRAGLEIGFKESAYLRAGINNLQLVSSLNGEKEWTSAPSMGIGLHINSIVIDYAFTHSGNVSQTLYSHIFTIRIDWNEAGE